MGRPELEEVLQRVIDRLPDGEIRDGQREMAEAVAEAIDTVRHLVVRAGTGTGKSIAYLVPALLSGKRVVVATATKALQDQLAGKDLPGIEPYLGRAVEHAVLKGRSNYLCVQRARESAVSGSQGEFGDDGPDRPTGKGRLGDQARAVADWARRTTSGDRAELPDEIEPRVWSAFSVTAEECPGAFRCPSGGDCFAEAARQRAAAADLVVTNLHLLGAHVASGGVVLPEHEVLIVDEAHALEEVMTESLGVSIETARLRALVAAARAAAPPAAEALRAATDDVSELTGRFEQAIAARPGERLRAGVGGELGELVELLVARLERVERELRSVESSAGADADSSQRAMRAVLVVGRLRDHLQRLATLDEDEVAWIEDGPRPSIEIAPLEVAPILAEQLFADRSVVLTSATVPPGLGERLGAPVGSTVSLDVGSPFAYEEHALLYSAAHLPDRRRPEAEPAIHEELVGLIEAAGGRTLALFTSRAAMNRAVEAVRPRIAHPILCQGDGAKGGLIAAFSSDPEASLFATMGFWQGVDVPGSTLSLVVIDRLPFSRPDDPLVSARRERAGSAAFSTIDLPRTASLLAQGAGRLIRTGSDRGVVAVLDGRLATASYRWALVRALPPMRRTKDPLVARRFLRSLRDGTATEADASTG